ncbi:MAG: YtxH domain-containing protein [Myxococcota bacterium]
MAYLENLSPDHVLNAIGLRRNTETSMMTDAVLPALAVFGAGLVVGAGIALLLAPTSGRELRDDLQRKAGELSDTVRAKVPAIANNLKKNEANPNPIL